MSQPVTDQEPQLAAAPVQKGPDPLANGQHDSRSPLPKFDTRARNISLVVVAIVALLPIGFALRSGATAQQTGAPKDEQPAKDKAVKDGHAGHEMSKQPDKKSGDKAGDGAKALTITGPSGLHIALDSPAAIRGRAKELGLDDKQRQELEKLDGSAREQARKLLTEKQRQQLGEIPPEWLSMMQMAQLQDTLQQMQQQMRQMPMSRSGQGQMPMGQGGQMQDMMQMMKLMQQMMGQGGSGMGSGGMGPDMMQQMMRMMQQMMGQGGSGQGGTGATQGGGGQDMMQMMRMMQQMMGQGGSGMGQGGMGQGGAGMGQGGQMQDMMRMMQMMQMMNQGGQKSKGG